MLNSEALAHLPADAYAVSVARDAVYVGCRDGSVVRVPRPHGMVSKLAAACKGGNIVADGADVFVLDVRGRTIVRDNASNVTTVASVRFSGVGVLDDVHLFFTTLDFICRVARGGGPVQNLVQAPEPELLGIHDRSLVFTCARRAGDHVQVGVLPLDGGRPRALVIEGILAGCVRLCGGAIVTLDEEHRLARRDLAGNVPVALAKMADWPEYEQRARLRPFLKADARFVYFDDEVSRDRTHVSRWPLSGGPVASRATSGIVHDASGEDGLFWLTKTAEGTELHGWTA